MMAFFLSGWKYDKSAGWADTDATQNGVYLLVFYEIYLTQVYGKPDLAAKVVIYVRASTGDTTLFFNKCRANAVYGYEPDEAR